MTALGPRGLLQLLEHTQLFPSSKPSHMPPASIRVMMAHIYILTCMHPHTYIRKRAYAHTCIDTHIYLQKYTYIHTYKYVHKKIYFKGLAHAIVRAVKSLKSVGQASRLEKLRQDFYVTVLRQKNSFFRKPQFFALKAFS